MVSSAATSTITSPTITLKKTEVNTCLINTVSAGCATLIFFGPQVAVISMIATATLYWMNPNRDQEHWLSTKKFHNFTGMVSAMLPTILVIAIIKEMICWYFGLGPIQEVQRWILRSKTIQELAYTVFYGCIRAPFFEEIIFRGVLQDGIKNFQSFVYHYLPIVKPDGLLAMTTRVACQALIFGALHYHPLQSFEENLFVILVVTLGGMLIGSLKEHYNNLWGSIGYHFSINTGVILPLIGFNAMQIPAFSFIKL